jgi:hypothetical protein
VQAGARRARARGGARRGDAQERRRDRRDRYQDERRERSARERAAQDRRREDGDTFTWSERMRDGSWLRVKNLNGPITVTASDGDVAEVRGEKSWRRGDPEEVRIEVIRDGDNVTICALWNEDAWCDQDDYRHEGRGRGDQSNDVSVEFTVRLPRGVNVNVATVNGGVDVNGADAAVEAHTVNGRVDASSSGGPVRAATVNGSVFATIGSLEGSGDLSFSTVNGSVTVEVPSSLDADIEMSTVNGHLRTEFPITVSGRVDPHHLRATIGRGGRRLHLKTVNGGIELRKRGRE